MKKAFIILIKILILLIGLFFGIMNISRSYITGGVTIIAGIIIWLSINKLSAGSLYPWRQWLWIIISVIAAVGIQVILLVAKLIMHRLIL